MNILEQEDIIKGLPDQALMQEAKMPSGQVPQFLVVSEIQRRKDMRKRYSAERPQEGTVKDQILGEASMGIMGAMPPQMAMAPQVPQRMPQMPPQGIQQAMPPQRMSGGGIVRMANGGRTQEILDLVAVGLSPLQITQKGYQADEIAAAMDQYRQKMNAPVDPIFSGSAEIVGAPQRQDSSVQRRPSGFFDDPGAIGDAVRENVIEPISSAADYVSEIPGRVAQSARMAQAKNPLSDSLLLASDLGGNGEDSGYSPVPTMNVARQQTDYGGALSDLLGVVSSPFRGLFEGDVTGPVVAPGGIANVGASRTGALGEKGELKAEEGREAGSVPAQQLGDLVVDPNLVPADASGDDPVEKAFRDQNPYGIERVDTGDATIPTGADAAAGRLSELQAMIDKQSAASSSAAKGAALVALGTSIMEGKTAQGGAKAAEILAKDAQTRGALQLEGAKLRLADARQGEKLTIMRQDLANKLQITDRQSLMAALKSYGDSITALANDRTRLMTEEGQALMRRLTEEQSLLRGLLIPDVDLGGEEDPAPTPSQPSGVDLKKYLNP